MTVGELLTALEEFDEKSKVILAMQPNYPLISTVKKVVRVTADDEEDALESDTFGDSGEVAIILEGASLGYGNDDWWSMPGMF